MTDIFRKISRAIRHLRGGRGGAFRTERRRAPRFICSARVVWEVGREQGEGELREISSTGLKLRTDRAILAGKYIRIRPHAHLEAAPLSIDVAIGTVVYSRPRGGRFEVGIELINPERLSRFAWIGKLLHGDCTLNPNPQPPVPAGAARLRLVKGSRF